MPTYLVIVKGSVAASDTDFEKAKATALSIADNETGAAIAKVVGQFTPVTEPFVFTSLEEPTSTPAPPSRSKKKSEPEVSVITPPVTKEGLDAAIEALEAEEEELAPVVLGEEEMPVVVGQRITEEQEAEIMARASKPSPEAAKKTSEAETAESVPNGVDIEKWKERYLDLWLHRVPFDAGYCPRCGDENTMSAVVPPLGRDGDGKIRICNVSGCHASDVAQRSMFGREDHHPDSSAIFTAAVKEAPKQAAPPAPAAPVSVPDAAEVTDQTEVFGIMVDTPPEEWAHELITKKGGESDGGQCKALNTALSEIGWSGDLRHSAVQVILDDPFISSLSDLTKAQADLCLKWLDKAQPQHHAAVKKRMDKWAKDKKIGIDAQVID